MYPWCWTPAGNRSLKIPRARPSLQKERLPRPTRLSLLQSFASSKKLSELVKISPTYFCCLSFPPFTIHSTCDFQKVFFTQIQLVAWSPSHSAQEPLAVWASVPPSGSSLCLDCHPQLSPDYADLRLKLSTGKVCSKKPLKSPSHAHSCASHNRPRPCDHLLLEATAMSLSLSLVPRS